ncbi:UNVERIFIED_CONTAM: hypothetical protein Slati_4591900 [Sesamum latifolium]|uniref:Uncharacterized protein n=1 Tax=Sesamum latifolium TaxID=2727402 RepID=A0AAW2S3C3_9LAMI
MVPLLHPIGSFHLNWKSVYCADTSSQIVGALHISCLNALNTHYHLKLEVCVLFYTLFPNVALVGNLCLHLHSFPKFRSCWKSVPHSALSSQLMVESVYASTLSPNYRPLEVCASLCTLPYCCSIVCLPPQFVHSLLYSLHNFLNWWVANCASSSGKCVSENSDVPQDSASNTPELIWNGGSVESVCTLHTLSPTRGVAVLGKHAIRLCGKSHLTN